MANKINAGGADKTTYQVTFTANEMSHLQPALSDRLEQLKDLRDEGDHSKDLAEAIKETSDLLDKINSYSDEEQP